MRHCKGSAHLCSAFNGGIVPRQQKISDISRHLLVVRFSSSDFLYSFSSSLFSFSTQNPDSLCSACATSSTVNRYSCFWFYLILFDTSRFWWFVFWTQGVTPSFIIGSHSESSWLISHQVQQHSDPLVPFLSSGASCLNQFSSSWDFRPVNSKESLCQQRLKGRCFSVC